MIPIPELPKQKEIIEKINRIHSHGQQLQQEAEEALEMAKKEVEQMILGE